MSNLKLYERKPGNTILGWIALRFTNSRVVNAIAKERQIDQDSRRIEKQFVKLLSLIEEHNRK